MMVSVRGSMAMSQDDGGILQHRRLDRHARAAHQAQRFMASRTWQRPRIIEWNSNRSPGRLGARESEFEAIGAGQRETVRIVSRYEPSRFGSGYGDVLPAETPDDLPPLVKASDSQHRELVLARVLLADWSFVSEDRSSR